MSLTPLNREQSYSRAGQGARVARDRLRALAHELPEGVPRNVLDLWVDADAALLAFIRAVESAKVSDWAAKGGEES